MPRAKAKPKVLDAPQASHGERAELLQAQRDSPYPTGGAPAAPTAPSQGQPGAPGGPGSGSPPARRSPQDVMKIAQSQMPMRGPGLGAPSQRPDEPITAGAPIGPGPGPVRNTGRTAKFLSQMAAMSDDPLLNRLARQAEAKGL